MSVAFAAAAYGQRRPRPRDRDRDVPDVNRVKVVNMLAEARKANVEAVRLRKEAVEGRIPDRSKSRQKSKGPRWIDLTPGQRMARFREAKKNHTTAVRKAAEAENFLKKHPKVTLDKAPATAKKKCLEEYAVTLVAEARFRMEKSLGALQQWQRLCDQALKLDRTSAEARQLAKELKALAEEQKKADEKTETPKQGEQEKKEAGQKTGDDADKTDADEGDSKAETE
jgi:hypothetical protein